MCTFLSHCFETKNYHWLYCILFLYYYSHSFFFKLRKSLWLLLFTLTFINTMCYWNNNIVLILCHPLIMLGLFFFCVSTNKCFIIMFLFEKRNTIYNIFEFSLYIIYSTNFETKFTIAVKINYVSLKGSCLILSLITLM